MKTKFSNACGAKKKKKTPIWPFGSDFTPPLAAGWSCHVHRCARLRPRQRSRRSRGPFGRRLGPRTILVSSFIVEGPGHWPQPARRRLVCSHPRAVSCILQTASLDFCCAPSVRRRGGMERAFSTGRGLGVSAPLKHRRKPRAEAPDLATSEQSRGLLQGWRTKGPSEAAGHHPGSPVVYVQRAGA